MRLRPLDFAAAILAAAAIALSSASIMSGGGALRVVVSGDAGEWVYPLDKEQVVGVDGPVGRTYVEIHGRAVHIESSPCRNQTCVAAGDIVSAGQWVACLPNRVFVRIEGGEADDAIDARAF